jgi:hypothetical protein
MLISVKGPGYIEQCASGLGERNKLGDNRLRRVKGSIQKRTKVRGKSVMWIPAGM